MAPFGNSEPDGVVLPDRSGHNHHVDGRLRGVLLNAAIFVTGSLRRICIALAVLTMGGAVHAEPPRETDPAMRISADEIRGRIETLQTRTDVVASDKQLTLENLQLALARLQSAEGARKLAAEFAESLKQAPERIAELQAQLAEPHEPQAEGAQAEPLKINPAEVQLRMAALQIRLVSLRAQRRELDESLRAMTTRKIDARSELADLRSQLERRTDTLPLDASQMLIDSAQIKDDAVRQDLSARIERNEQEILSLPTREAIASAQLTVLGRDLDQTQTDISSLGRRMDAREQEEVHDKLDRARQAVVSLDGKPEPLQSLAKETQSLRESMFGIANELRKLWSTKDRLHGQLEDVSALRKSAEQILAFGRIGEEYGRLLRDVGKKLPGEASLTRRIAKRQNSIVDVRVERFRSEQKLAVAGTGAAAVDQLMNQLGDTTQADTRTLAQSLLKDRREALQDLNLIQGRQVEALDELNQLETELRERSAQLRLMLNQRLLWLPSALPVTRLWGGQLVAGFTKLFAQENRAEMLPAVRASLSSRPLPYLGFAIVILAMLSLRKRLLAQLEKLAKPVGTRADRFELTLYALAVTFLLALPIPLAIMVLAQMLAESANPASLPSAIGRGFFNVGIILLILGLFRNMCRRDGLFVSHFLWRRGAVRRLGLGLWRLSLALIPAVWLSGVAHVSDDPIYADGIGRLGLLMISIALAAFAYQVFRPNGGAMMEILERKGLLWRTRYIWYGVLVLTPLLLAGVAMVGYTVSASELQGRLITSAWVVLLIIIVFQIAMRGVLVAGRRAAYRQAEARLARQREEDRAGEGADSAGEGSPIVPEEPEIDVVTVSQQTRGILRATSFVLLVMLLWNIWSGLIPALGIFNSVVLWSSVASTSAGQVVTAVTLGSVLLAVVLLGLTVIAARNLPGFLEVVVLHRFEIDSGSRYAYVTITRYVILAVGLVLAFSKIGADWSKLQWIVAALGVGLGFGLQEIVANFVSGIIILFERPIRVGDQITIDDTVGTVSRIQIRAITITDPDNFEVLVPNKAFITRSVKNWSLTSQVTRLVVKVGIGYGSDVGLAQKIMLDIARANEHVVESPGPMVLFLGFGDSSLNLELRVFVGRIDQRLSTLHALHVAVLDEFTKAGIEIPFPQRDVHLHGLATVSVEERNVSENVAAERTLPAPSKP